MSKKTIPIIALLLIVGSSSLQSQQIYSSVVGGRSKYQYADFGACISGGTNILYLVNEHLMIGMRVSYFEWDLQSTRAVYGLADDLTITGKKKITEVAPLIRVLERSEDPIPFAVFAQLGLCYFNIGYEIRDANPDWNVRDYSRPGFSFGVGFTLGEISEFQIEIAELYDLSVMGDRILSYSTFAVGIGRGF